MNCHPLYTVTLTDLGTYTATVAASSADEAQSIAKAMLFEEATQLPDGLSITKRDCDVVAVLDEVQPTQVFDASATYMLDFTIKVAASNRREAADHARRLYEINCGPFEFEHNEDRVSPFTAREVVS